MSVNLKFENKTSSGVIFGLWSAPNNHSTVQKVEGNGTASNHTDNADARVVGAWTDSNNLYPNDDYPFTTGVYLQDGQSYIVTLTTETLSVIQSES
jgi:hypothetical protein